MSVWVVRAGAHGEQEDFALDRGLAVIGFDNLPDLSSVTSREDIQQMYGRVQPGANAKAVTTWAAQAFAFSKRMRKGDLIVLPLKKRSALAIGEVVGDYRYDPALPAGCRHTRTIKWLRQDVSRSSFAQDLLYVFGAFLTVFQATRNDAERRVRSVLAGQSDPVLSDVPLVLADVTRSGGEELLPPDLEQYARDQIVLYIGRKFKGHELTNLVMSILAAQGYKAHVSPAGADGGVDILAGRGPMGFDPPKLCVQVKSGSQPVDVQVLRALQGTMKQFGAEQGLLVSWGGFTGAADREARQLFFQIRLWDSGGLVDALLENYDQIPETLRAELPLSRLWALVPEE